MGLSWYTWLEQGRDITPSASVLDALARVLDLGPPERTHLFDLAGVPAPVATEPYPTVAPPELAAVVEGLEPNPAYLLGPRTDVLAWNRVATRLLGAPTRAPDGETNLLWWLFTTPGDGGPTRQGTARNTLARFRAEHARRYDDPAFTTLIGQLLEVSPAFRELWPRHEVLDAQLGTKRVDHPEMGPLVLHHLQSIPKSHPDLRLTQFVPATTGPGSRSAADAQPASDRTCSSDGRASPRSQACTSCRPSRIRATCSACVSSTTTRRTAPCMTPARIPPTAPPPTTRTLASTTRSCVAVRCPSGARRPASSAARSSRASRGARPPPA